MIAAALGTFESHLLMWGLLLVAGLAVAVAGELATRRTGGARGRSGQLWDRQHADG